MLMLWSPLVLCLCIGLANGNSLHLTFWLDPLQHSSLEADMEFVFKELNSMYLGVRLTDSMLVLQPADEQQNMYNFCEILNSRGSTVIIDLSYQRWQQGYDLALARGIPYVRVDRILRPFLEMFAGYIGHKHGNNVAMIFQNGRDTEEAMLHMLEGYPFRTLILNANAAKDEQGLDFVGRLLAMRPAPTYYAIFARGVRMSNIFDSVRKGGLFQRPTEWHFVFLDPRDRLFKYRWEAQWGTKFTLKPREVCRSMQMRDIYCSSGFTLQRAILVDLIRSLSNAARNSPSFPLPIRLDCNASVDEAAANASVQLATSYLRALQLSDFLGYAPRARAAHDGRQRIADEAPPAEQELQVAALPPLRFLANITAAYYYNLHNADTDLAVWNGMDWQLINKTISASRRYFRIGTAESLPWSYRLRNQSSGELLLDKHGAPIWAGYCIEFMARLAQRLNFEYDIVAPSKGHMGERDEFGQWDGVIGDLVSGETDFAIAALKMYSEREEVVDFLPPYYEQTGISIVIRKPVRRTSLFKFMTVLRLEVWLCIVGALISTALMIWFMDRFSPYSSRNNRDAYPYDCREFTLRESFWFALTSFTPQGGGEAPKAISGRLLVAAYWLFVVLMLATFTANLAAFLTVERMQTPVQSLEQLARQSRINYTVVENSDTHHYFMNMKFAEETLYRMWKELALNASKDFHKFRIWDYPIKEQYGHILLAINSSNPVSNASAGFHNVDLHENGDYAFIHDSAEIKYELTRNCNLTEVGEVFAEQPYAVAVQQGSHLGDELSYTILELQKERFFEELKEKYWNQSNIRNCPVSEDQEGITLQSLGGVFLATLFGLVLALITLGVEVIYHRRQLKKFTVTQVKPMAQRQWGNLPHLARAWQLNADGTVSQPANAVSSITPPPSFEDATLNDAMLLSKITLGANKFKPRARKLNRVSDAASASNQLMGGSYME